MADKNSQTMEWINMGMTPELQKYYEDRLSMFSETAWKELVEDVQNMLESSNKLDGVEDEKSLHFRRGEISIMRWIINLEPITNAAYEELKLEDKS